MMLAYLLPKKNPLENFILTRINFLCGFLCTVGLTGCLALDDLLR